MQHPALIGLFTLLSTMAFGQISYQYDLTPANLTVQSLPTPTGTFYPATDYSTITTPLVAEPFADDAGFAADGTAYYASAAGPGPVFYAGNEPGEPVGSVCTGVFTEQVFAEVDFPLRLTVDLFNSGTHPDRNEGYLHLAPADYAYYNTTVFYIPSISLIHREGLILGTYPGRTVVQHHRSTSENTVLSNDVTHNLAAPGQWYTLAATFDRVGSGLQISEVTVNGSCVYDEPILVPDVDWLGAFRVGFLADDLARNFRIDTRLPPAEGGFSGPDELCAGDCATFVNNEPNSLCGEASTHVWAFPGGVPASFTGSQPPPVCYSTPGSYSITLTTTTGGASTTSTTDIEVLPSPTVGLGPDLSLCAADTATLTVPTGFDGYSWSTGATGPGIEVSTTGTYAVTVSDGACTGSDSVAVLVQENPELFTDAERTRVLCDDAPLLLEATTPGATAYTWSTGSEMATTTVTTAGVYTVSVRFDPACPPVVDSVRVLANPVGFVLDLPAQQSLCGGQTLVLDVVLPPGVTLTWSDGSTAAELPVTGGGTYGVTATDGCTVRTAQTRVLETNCCEPFVPNAFSPNGDGINDRFGIFYNPELCQNVLTFELQVFGRWGNLLWATTDPDARWDGRFRGQVLDPQVLAWRMVYQTTRRTYRESGDLTLMR